MCGGTWQARCPPQQFVGAIRRAPMRRGNRRIEQSSPTSSISIYQVKCCSHPIINNRLWDSFQALSNEIHLQFRRRGVALVQSWQSLRRVDAESRQENYTLCVQHHGDKVVLVLELKFSILCRRRDHHTVRIGQIMCSETTTSTTTTHQPTGPPSKTSSNASAIRTFQE